MLIETEARRQGTPAHLAVAGVPFRTSALVWRFLPVRLVHSAARGGTFWCALRLVSRKFRIQTLLAKRQRALGQRGAYLRVAGVGNAQTKDRIADMPKLVSRYPQANNIPKDRPLDSREEGQFARRTAGFGLGKEEHSVAPSGHLQEVQQFYHPKTSFRFLFTRRIISSPAKLTGLERSKREQEANAE